MATLNKIDSNITGLRYAVESSLGVLPAAASQFWFPFEPNSYSDFGGQITTVARNPINPSRQRKKGVVTDLDASGGFNTDLTQTNLRDILQGFMFADLRTKQSFTGAQTVTAASDTYGATGIHTGFFAGDLILASGFTNTANNGLKNVTAAAANTVTVSQSLVDESSPATAKIQCVGFQFGAGEVEIVVPGGGDLPRLNRASGSKDFTQLGLIPGEFVFIGGDSAPTQFATAANNGLARVRAVTATTITFDKTQGTMVADNGATKTIQIFKPAALLKNETGTLIKRRSYTLERTLGANNDSDLTREQAEYLTGAIGSEFTLNVPTAEKLNVDLSFQSLRNSTIDENITGANTLLSKAAVVAGSAANAPAIVEADAFNTSSDVSRIKLATFTEGTTNPAPLFAFAQELTLTLNNNLTPNKAIGVLGAFEVTAGTFEVGGSITAYFADVAAVQAVRNNADITLDAHFIKANAGISFDVPLITLGDARLNVEQDAPITLPLENAAATGAKIHPTLNHTLMIMFWDYLPAAADA